MTIIDRLQKAYDDARKDLQIAITVNTERGDVVIDRREAGDIITELEKYIDARLALFTALQGSADYADK